MKAEFINPFIAATCEVFRTMLSCEAKRGAPTLDRNALPGRAVSGLIGLSGSYQGMVVFGLGDETAIRVAEILLGDRPDSVNGDVVDAIGEVTNMIAGAAKAKLEEYQLSVGLPTVICGQNQIVSFPTGTRPIALPFTTDLGPICIEVGLVESPVLV